MATLVSCAITFQNELAFEDHKYRVRIGSWKIPVAKTLILSLFAINSFL